MKHAHYIRYQNGEANRIEPAEFSLLAPKRTELAVFSTLATWVIDGKPAVFRLEKHIERLLDNATELSLLNRKLKEHQESFLKEIIFELLRATATNEHRVRARIVLTKTGAELFVDPYENPWDPSAGIDVISTSAIRELPQCKSTQQAACRAARNEAVSNNAHEALLIDEKGILREGAWSNVFWFDENGSLYSPQSKVLAGTTRAAVCEIAEVNLSETPFNRVKEQAVEMFLTQATSGITPVRSLDGTALEVGSHTTKMQEQFRMLVSDEGVLVG